MSAVLMSERGNLKFGVAVVRRWGSGCFHDWTDGLTEGASRDAGSLAGRLLYGRHAPGGKDLPEAR